MQLLSQQHLRSEERRVGKSVDLGGRRIIKKSFFQAEDGIRDILCRDWSSDVCSSDLVLIEIGQQDVLSKGFQWTVCVSGQPIFDDLLFRFHSIRIFEWI